MVLTKMRSSGGKWMSFLFLALIVVVGACAVYAQDDAPQFADDVAAAPASKTLWDLILGFGPTGFCRFCPIFADLRRRAHPS